MAAAMDGVVSPADGDRDRSPRRSRVPQPRRSVDALRRPRSRVRGDRVAAGREGDAPHAGALRRADQARAHRAAHPRDQGRRRHRVRVAHAATRRAVLQARPRRRARRPRRAGHGRVGRARVEGPRAPAAQPEEVHPRVRPARDRRRLRVVLHGAAPHAHRRGRRARRRRPRSCLHQPGRARHRRAAGHRDRRRGGRAVSATSTRPASTCTSSPMVACGRVATSPRRSRAAPTR